MGKLTEKRHVITMMKYVVKLQNVRAYVCVYSILLMVCVEKDIRVTSMTMGMA